MWGLERVRFVFRKKEGRKIRGGEVFRDLINLERVNNSYRGRGFVG